MSYRVCRRLCNARAVCKALTAALPLSHTLLGPERSSPPSIPQRVPQVLELGAVATPMYKLKGPKMIAGDHAPLTIDRTDPVAIAVKSQSEIEILLSDETLQISKIRLVSRIGMMVGKFAVHFGERRAPSSRVVPPRGFDTQHVGTKVLQQFGRVGPSQDAGQIEDAHAFEGSEHARTLSRGRMKAR